MQWTEQKNWMSMIDSLNAAMNLRLPERPVGSWQLLTSKAGNLTISLSMQSQRSRTLLTAAPAAATQTRETAQEFCSRPPTSSSPGSAPERECRCPGQETTVSQWSFCLLTMSSENIASSSWNASFGKRVRPFWDGEVSLQMRLPLATFPDPPNQ